MRESINDAVVLIKSHTHTHTPKAKMMRIIKFQIKSIYNSKCESLIVFSMNILHFHTHTAINNIQKL